MPARIDFADFIQPDPFPPALCPLFSWYPLAYGRVPSPPYARCGMGRLCGERGSLRRRSYILGYTLYAVRPPLRSAATTIS